MQPGSGDASILRRSRHMPEAVGLAAVVSRRAGLLEHAEQRRCGGVAGIFIVLEPVRRARFDRSRHSDVDVSPPGGNQ